MGTYKYTEYKEGVWVRTIHHPDTEAKGRGADAVCGCLCGVQE